MIHTVEWQREAVRLLSLPVLYRALPSEDKNVGAGNLGLAGNLLVVGKVLRGR